jgi:hypothetical protein
MVDADRTKIPFIRTSHKASRNGYRSPNLAVERISLFLLPHYMYSGINLTTPTLSRSITAISFDEGHAATVIIWGTLYCFRSILLRMSSIFVYQLIKKVDTETICSSYRYWNWNSCISFVYWIDIRMAIYSWTTTSTAPPKVIFVELVQIHIISHHILSYHLKNCIYYISKVNSF